MHLRFDANLEFQRDAVNAVADLFGGMARTAPLALTPVLRREDQVSEAPVERCQ